MTNHFDEIDLKQGVFYIIVVILLLILLGYFSDMLLWVAGILGATFIGYKLFGNFIGDIINKWNDSQKM